jgi:hypothetical protein
MIETRPAGNVARRARWAADDAGCAHGGSPGAPGGARKRHLSGFALKRLPVNRRSELPAARARRAACRQGDGNTWRRRVERPVQVGGGVACAAPMGDSARPVGSEKRMDIVARVKAMLASPATEWPRIEDEPADPAYLFFNYLAILALIPAIAGFIGMSIVGVWTPNSGTLRVPLVAGLFNALLGYVFAFIVVYIMALVIDAMAPRFEGQRNFPNALRLAVYGSTPMWLAGIFMVIPGLRFLIILGFYGLYIVWSGLPRLMKVPPTRLFSFVACIAAAAFILVFALGMIQAAVAAIMRGV